MNQKKRLQITPEDYIDLEICDTEYGKSVRLTSNLTCGDSDFAIWNVACSVIESCVMTHAACGMDVTSEAYVMGVRRALEEAATRYT